MSGERFGSLTAAFLVRKGEAAPSPVAPPSNPFVHATPHSEPARPAPLHPEQLRNEVPRLAQAVPEIYPRSNMPLGVVINPPKSASEVAVLASRAQAGPWPLGRDAARKPHRLALSLSAAEYEAIGIVAVKKHSTRQQLLRGAFETYMASVAQTYAVHCPCIVRGSPRKRGA